MNKIRVRREFRNIRSRTIIGGAGYVFDSKFEMKWARYLQFLKEQEEILEWYYHPVKFDFRSFDYKNKPYVYTPDFSVIENDGSLMYHEAKGYIETKDISRLRRANKHYDVDFWLVMQRIPKKGKQTQILAKVCDYAFVKRVVDASKIFNQVKHVIQGD
jgi:hypothetical protein